MTEPYILDREQWVPASLQEVFPFFADAANLQALTPEWLSFQILTPQPIAMRAGALIDYRLRWHGVPLNWKTQILVWEPPHHFEDLQLKGPYKLWHHTHRFESVSGGTRILDHVRYALPFGILGRAVHAVSVRNNIEEIFRYRQEKVRDLFGGKSTAGS